MHGLRCKHLQHQHWRDLIVVMCIVRAAADVGSWGNLVHD
jgi:hypothetical protein